MFMLPSKFGFIVTEKCSGTGGTGNTCSLFDATDIWKKTPDYKVQ